MDENAHGSSLELHRDLRVTALWLINNLVGEEFLSVSILSLLIVVIFQPPIYKIVPAFDG
jgi:hypothetical protein